MSVLAKLLPSVLRIRRKGISHHTQQKRKIANSGSTYIAVPMRDHFGHSIIEISDWCEFLKQSKINFEKNYHETTAANVTKEDFEILETIGKGGFGRVHLGQRKSDNVFHAIKILEKAKLIKLKQVTHCLNEKQILQAINCPFCVHLEYFYQDRSHLYYVMPTVLGGELFRHLRKFGKMNENHSKFYAAQVVLALEYLHNLELVYRDLKPENILLDHTGYVKLTDFGFCKYVRGRTYTFCGTPEYLAPEVILNKGYGKSVDWWSFGVLLFEMSAGYAPFPKDESGKMYKNIINGKYRQPGSFSADLKEVIRRTLQTDVSRRYGVLKDCAGDVKQLRWFKGYPWLSLANKKVDPPFVPKVKNPGDTSNFHRYKEESIGSSRSGEGPDAFSEF